MTLTWLDWGVVAGYVVALLTVGFGVAPRWAARWQGSEVEEYLLAGRRLTLPLFVATLVATWYGAILGVGEFVYRSGVVAWLCVGVPYYLVALAFAAFVAGRIRTSQTMTIPEQFRSLYGDGAGLAAAATVLIITIPTSYLLMLATLLRMFTGWSLGVALVVGAAASVAYLYGGGFRADVLTNTVQFVLMYVGFVVLAAFCIQQWGPPQQMWQALPATHRSIPGELGWGGIAVWFILALQTFVDPSFYQRCAAARSVRTARWGIAAAVLFWLLFDTLTIMTALYARAYVATEPLMAYLALAEAALPAGWKGVFVVALFATVMSTLESYAFLSAATLGHDILGRIPALARRLSVRQLTQLGLVISMLVAGGVAWALPSAVELIVRTGSLAVPALLFPFLVGYSTRWQLQPRRVGVIMAATVIASAVWMVAREAMLIPASLRVVEPAFVGVLVGMGATLLWSRRRHAIGAVDRLERD